MSDPILIIEDEFFIAFEMKRILELHGYEVAGIAADRDAAMAIANQGIALALVDLNLRDGLTGPDIGARLAQDLGVTVIFITANPRQLGDGVAGTIGVLTKPADAETLTDAVSFALERRRGLAKEPPRALRCFG